VAFFKMDPSWRGVDGRIEGRAPVVTADSELVKVALQNLLINGLQAMAGRGTLVVTLGVSGDAVSIDVTDSGPGIVPEAQAKLFTPFFTTKSRGTGLGLATVKRIAEAHHGDVRVVSSGSTGTTMRFTLPIDPPRGRELD
jgi:two-component system sensor histidine kinase HydH